MADSRNADILGLGNKGDTAISRTAAGAVAIGNGTPGDVSGALAVRAITLNGASINTAGPVLKVGGVATANQALLDLIAGANIAITDNGDGTVTFAVAGPVTRARTAITADGAIDAHTAKDYIVTKSSALAALTLAAPTVTTDDGKRISVSSATAKAHTITATGLLQTGSASVNVATFAAFAGAGLVLEAYQGVWLVLSSNGVTFS